MVVNDTYITASTVCELLIKISEMQLQVPITLILDNARYQKCKLVAECAKSFNIELLYLPTYSPNLNLIERLWQFVKKKKLYSTYYGNFQDFKQAISTCLAQNHTIYKKRTRFLADIEVSELQKSKIMTE